ncbi:MAG: 2OG-Fe(II) oxygenase [Pseudomonadota bacterium]|nr:2OG-Fe(II) oxygenase [Pseudomonadota bacterium]
MVDALVAPGYWVCPKFVCDEIVLTLAREAQTFWQANAFRQAQVGTGSQRRLRRDIRSDHVMWVEPASASPALQHYLVRIEELRCMLNQSLYLGLQRFEAHYAAYPPGSFYQRHLDQFQSARHRVVSCILYLNADWAPTDGGALRLYEREGGGAVDVLPQAGTLVVLRSDQIEHEVLRAQRLRWSLCGWLRLDDDPF